ncbi:MAG: thioredoxin domain-containing protein [Candidatus Omnitrophica bacterium]|nr:thioredoxin domain-containing protein [Candidatus Omnitrophota bacterium]
MKISKPVLGVLVILVCVGSVAFARAILLKKQPVISLRPLTSANPRAKGDSAAPIKVVEFTDFQCPACAKASEAVHDLANTYPSRIYIELKYFPLPMHAFANRAAMYAECAAQQGKFWPWHDVIFKSQSSWSKMSMVDPYFSQLAVSIGLDGIRMAACVNSSLPQEKIKKDVMEGEGLHVNSTPTFFVNGKMAVGRKNFVEAVEALIKPNAK